MARQGKQLIRRRARNRCEYCQLPQSCTELPHEIDHIRAKKHRGLTTLENTCLACAYCNGAKGTNVAGYDPDTDVLVRLFNPRTDDWSAHFVWDEAVLVGITAIGRTTTDLLKINSPDRVLHRRLLIADGSWAAE